MIKVKDKKDYGYLFESYTHNIPVIYGSLNGQYDADLYVDQEKQPNIAILFTSFDFHYIVGKVSDKNIKWLEKVIFENYLLDKNEAVFYTPSETWEKAIDKLFTIKDARCIYELKRDKYNAFKREYNALNDIEVVIKETKEGAHLSYPICEIIKDHKRVSFCSGFMLGKGHAEIMIETDEAYRRKGYALEAAFHLIKYLQSKDIEPDWCTWPVRKASRALAEKLGFELREEIPVHVWVKGE